MENVLALSQSRAVFMQSGRQTSKHLYYVLGGPLQPNIEMRKLGGEQPLAEFNVFATRNGTQIVGTDQVGGGHPTSMRRRIALAWRITSRRLDYDALLASGEDIGIPLLLCSLLRRVRKPVWIILHGSYLEGRKFALIAPMLRRAGHVHFLCLSEALQHRMIRDGFPAGRCHNAGYGVDTNFFHPRGAADGRLVLAAGSANRDYRTLVSAVDGLDVSLRIAADSLWRPKAADVDTAALPDSVEVGSAGDYLGLRDLYGRASFVVVPLHPARYASGYAVIAEAMAMGKAIISTQVEAHSDLIVEGETGFYTKAGDVAALREKIALLLDDPALARRMGEAAARRMQEKFSLDAYCHRMERIIQQEPA